LIIQVVSIGQDNNCRIVKLEYQFRVLDSPVVNAFAVPGGYIYFTRGILAHFNNEAEFAGVLGHEIGHVTARHSASQQSKAILAQVGLIAGMAISEDFRDLAGVASQGLQLLFLKYGRDDETQSDQLGVEYSTKIGYDAYEMADFFGTLNRLSEKSGQRLPTFMSTHPDPLDRYGKVRQEASRWQQQYPREQLAVNRDSYLQMIDGLVYGEDPRQGFVENSVFYHPELKFQYPVPRGWQTQNSPQQVVHAPEDGKGILLLRIAQGNTLQEAAQATLEQFQLTFRESNNLTVSGLPALAVIADQIPQDQAGQPPLTAEQRQAHTARVMLYFIQYNGLIYNFLGATSLNDFNSYRMVFSNSINNFRILNDPDKLNRQPERIRIKKVNQAASLSSTLQAYGVPRDRLEELAIVNGMKLKDQVPAGTLIKVIGE
jgi:predicted Zn-dependent protease